MTTKTKETEEKIKDIIFSFLDPKDYKVFIFGSRATGKARKFSDYDIGILGKRSLYWRKLALIKEALEESNLPIRVDVIDFSTVSPNFKKVALSKIKKL